MLYGLLDEAGSATALAASIAGAASLGLDPGSERLKGAMRHGACDFVVNHLDEALRILKNEIRKKKPVAVGLECDVATGLNSIVERGVQPDLLAFAGGGVDDGGPIDTNLAVLAGRGARTIGYPGPPGVTEKVIGDGARDGALAGVRWSVAESPARWLPKVDALALDVLSSSPEATSYEDLRLRWLRVSPRYFPRAAYHVVRMDDDEAERFVQLVRKHVASGGIGAAITLGRESGAGSERVETPG